MKFDFEQYGKYVQNVLRVCYLVANVRGYNKI